MTTQEIKDFRELKTKEDKIRFFEILQLKPLEDFVKEQLGYQVKFKKFIYIDKTDDEVMMNLESQELKHTAGIMQNIFKSLILKTFGNICIKDFVEQSRDCKAMLTKIMFPSLSFIYYYKDGGQSGHDCIYVKYDINNKNWYFRSCKDNFERIHAYDGTYRAWEEEYENDRQIEIKEI